MSSFERKRRELVDRFCPTCKLSKKCDVEGVKASECPMLQYAMDFAKKAIRNK